jgi:DNA polymerase V
LKFQILKLSLFIQSIATNIIPESQVQLNMFQSGDEKHTKLVNVLDKLNLRYGRNTVNMAVHGIHKEWQMKRSKLSPAYTTN